MTTLINIWKHLSRFSIALSSQNLLLNCLHHPSSKRCFQMLSIMAASCSHLPSACPLTHSQDLNKHPGCWEPSTLGALLTASVRAPHGCQSEVVRTPSSDDRDRCPPDLLHLLNPTGKSSVFEQNVTFFTIKFSLSDETRGPAFLVYLLHWVFLQPIIWSAGLPQPHPIPAIKQGKELGTKTEAPQSPLLRFPHSAQTEPLQEDSPTTELTEVP